MHWARELLQRHAQCSLYALLILPSSLRDPEANLAFRGLPTSLSFASTTVGKLPCGAVGCKMLQAMLSRHIMLLGNSTNRAFFVLLLLLSRLLGRKDYLFLCNDLKVYSREMNLEAERKVVRKDMERLVLSSAQICTAQSQATKSKAPGSPHGDPALGWVRWGRARNMWGLSFPEGSVSAGQTYSPQGPGGCTDLGGVWIQPKSMALSG